MWGRQPMGEQYWPGGQARLCQQGGVPPLLPPEELEPPLEGPPVLPLEVDPIPDPLLELWPPLDPLEVVTPVVFVEEDEPLRVDELVEPPLVEAAPVEPPEV